MGLFLYFREHGYMVSNPYHGIYYVEGAVLFPTQIVVTGELDGVSHIWLSALSRRMEKQSMARLLERAGRLSGKADQEFADSVLEVSIEANKQVVKELMGDDNMCQALMEIMEPQLLLRDNEVRKEGRIEGRKEGKIEGTVETMRDFGRGDGEIKEMIMQKYSLTEKEAQMYL